MLFYFVIYATIILSSVWIYEKFFKKMQKKQSWDEYVQSIGIFPQTTVKNTYLLKTELTSKVLFLIFFGWILSINLTPQADSLDELYRRMALGTAVFGIIFTLVTRNKILYKLITSTLYIKELKDSVVYEYVTEKGEIKTDTILKVHISSITWSIFPYASKSKDIWFMEGEKDSKRWAYVFSPLYLVLSAIYWLIYLILNKFKIEKYILFRTDRGIFSIPSKKLDLKKSVDFEWKSLINRFIINGASYANNRPIKTTRSIRTGDR